MSKPLPSRNRDPEHSERGDGRTVGAVEQAEAVATAAEPASGARPCEMILGAPDDADSHPCGEPSVGGGKLYRYCKRHLEQVERAGGVVHRDGWA